MENIFFCLYDFIYCDTCLYIYCNLGESATSKVNAYFENGNLMASIRIRNETYVIEVSCEIVVTFKLNISNTSSDNLF